METIHPWVAESGWYVELPGPAEAVLASKYRKLGKADRLAADAQAYLYLLEREKLLMMIPVLLKQRGMATLGKALLAEDALRWGELDTARSIYLELTKRGSVADGAVAAWARLREVEVLERSGHLAEARIKLDAARVIDAAATHTPVHQAVVAARLRFRRGDPAGALALLEQTPPTDETPSPIVGAWLRGQAIYTSLSGREDRALGQHRRALDWFRRLGDRYHLVKQYISLAQTFLEADDRDHAELYCEKAAEALAAAPHPHLRALVKSRSGMIALLQGSFERARTLFAEDVELSEGAGLRPGLYYARRNLGKVLVRLGQTADGAEYLAASRRGFARFDDPVNERLSRIEELAARLSDATDDELSEWEQELTAIAAFFDERRRPSLRAQVTAVLARLSVRRGAVPLAQDLIEVVVNTWRARRRADRLVEFLVDVAADFPRAHVEEAKRVLRMAYREADASGQGWATSRILHRLDDLDESAVLDLARTPRLPSGAPLPMPPAESDGFYHQSRSDAFRRLLDEAKNAARSNITVLLLGETGVGKEWVARYIHRESDRADQVYRAFNCGVVAESLLEAELFGYEKGAFTGAEQSRVGIFEAADGGTVLLDEVGELSARAQAALLRVLDQRVVQPVGSTQPREVDVRILAATNRDLASGVAEHTFREDLYYRLSVFVLQIPPLRRRVEDIPLLVQHFLERLGDAHRRKIRTVDDGAMQALLRYRWPGNLRELDNVLQSAVIRCKGRTIRRRHLPTHIAEPSSLIPVGGFASLADMERRHIKDALKQARGNQSEAAKLLGIHRNTLANKMRKYRIEG